MKNLITILAFLGLLGISHAAAQQFEVGVGWQDFGLNGFVRTLFDYSNANPAEQLYDEIAPYRIPAENLEFAYYLPVFRPTDELSVGIRGGVKGIFQFIGGTEYVDFAGNSLGSDGDQTLFGLQIPVTAMFRYGTGATSEAQSSLGFGLGAGLAYTAFSTDQVTQVNGAFYSPTLAAEAGYSKLRLRFQYCLSAYRTKYLTTTGELPKLTYKTFSLNFLLLF